MNYQLSTINSKAKGFTLIELLIVISIIAILVASATSSWQNAQQKGRDGKRKSDLKAVQQALELYFRANGKYPSTSSGQIQCNAGTDTSTRDWGSSFVCDLQTYMQQLPKDPAYQETTGYYYNNPDSTSYNLWAALENTNDPDLTGLPSSCGSPPTGRNYCVVNP